MRSRYFIAMSLAVVAAFATSASGSLVATRAAGDVVIDGTLAETCWQTDPVESFTVMDTDQPSAGKTQLWFAFDDRNLYIAMRCYGPNPDALRAEPVERDGRVLAADSVEVMIDADGDGDAYIHLGTNASGSQWDRRVMQSGWIGEAWDGLWRTASRVEQDHYTVEMAIPYFNLDIGPDMAGAWRVNVCRNYRPNGVAYTSIAPRGAYNAPADFRALTGIDADLRPYMFGIGPVRAETQFADGKTLVTLGVDVTNRAAVSNTIEAENWLIDLQDAVHVRTANPVTLDPGDSVSLQFGPYTLEHSGDYATWIVLIDPATRSPRAITTTSAAIECVPIALRVVEPSYRNTIFATQSLRDVMIQVDVGLDADALSRCALTIAVVGNADGNVYFEQAVEGVLPVNRFTFANATLPDEGRFTATVALTDGGEELARTQQTITKLPYKPGEVWIGRDRIFRRDGEPYFPNGGWGLTTPARNFQLYGVFPDRLSIPVEPGKTKVWYVTRGDDHEQIMSKQPLSAAFIEDLRERVRYYRDDSDILGWVMPDEPECYSMSPAKLRHIYEILREEDPYHPVFISNNSVEGVALYADCADVSVPHPYPPASPDREIGDFSKILVLQHTYDAHTGGGKPIGFMHQGFGYGEYVVGRRMPSYYELRNQNMLALAAGSTCIMGFEGSIPQTWYPEVSPGLDYLTEELAAVGSLVVAPTSDRNVTTDQNDVVMLLKEDGDQLHLFVSNASNDARRLTVSIEGMTSQSFHVVSEDRKAMMRDGSMADDYLPWQTHVYTTSANLPPLKTVDEIVAILEAEYQRRHKPGNIAYQRWDGQTVQITTSSRVEEYPPAPWHICDGLTDVVDERFHAHRWTDATPNEGPDWIALKFNAPQAIDRVAIHTIGVCVRDYTVQVKRNDQWVDVAGGNDNRAEWIEHSFDATTTDELRLLVTRTHGPNVAVNEIEIYAASR